MSGLSKVLLKTEKLRPDQVQMLLRIAVNKMSAMCPETENLKIDTHYSKQGHVKCVGQAQAFLKELRSVVDGT